MSAALSQLARRARPVLDRIIRSEELSVPDVAKLLKKPPKWVRANLPIIVHGPRSYHVRLVDLEAYQERRTVWPKVATIKDLRDILKNGKRAA